MPINDGDILEKMVQEARILGDARMVRDEQPLTEELVKAIIERFQQFLQRVGKSAETAARSMGMSASTLSQVLSGSYAADAEKHFRAIDKWLEQQIIRERAPKPPGFVKTKVAEDIYGVTSVVLKTSSIGLIHGPNGCGKTMTLQAIRAETPGAVYVSIDSSALTVRAVLGGIAAALRMTGLRLSRDQLFKQIAAMLDDTGRLIIVDEVHKLAGRTNDYALHVLRDLHDATKCPMLWVGNGKIASYIRENHSDGYDPLDQIFGRISIWLDLSEDLGGGDDGGGSPLFTVADIQKVFAAQKIRLTPDASRYLAALASDASYGCLRTAKYLVSLAVQVAKDEPITAEMLRAIQRQRLGRRSAEAVEIRISERLQAIA